MTRWARSGNTQKHKKMPTDATKWSEFSQQMNSNNSKSNRHSTNKVKKSRNRKLNISSSLIENSNEINIDAAQSQIKKKKFQKRNKKVKNENQTKIESVDLNQIENNVEMEIKDNTKEKPYIKEIMKTSKKKKSFSDNSANEKQVLLQEIDISLKNNENDFKDQNQTQQIIDSNIENNVEKFSHKNNNDKIAKKKKLTYREKLQKKRAQKGILLLPEKIERKLYKMKKTLRAKGMPEENIKEIVRQIRRKEELKFHKNTKICFNCRQRGHILSNCPVISKNNEEHVSLCFKCGSIEHISSKCPKNIAGYPFAICFICKEQGHITRDCPNNKHGIYPKGGKCNICGNVNHLKKDCPTLSKINEEEPPTLHMISEGKSVDDEIMDGVKTEKKSTKIKIVKF